MFRFMSKNGGDGCGGGGGGGGVALEVTVLSAELLRLPPPSYYSLIPRLLRPYVTVSSACSMDVPAAASGEHSWHDTLVVPSSLRAVAAAAACRLIGSTTPLGWCRIPAADVLDGLRPPRALRRLSYSLCYPRTSGPAHGVVHLAVRVLGDLVPPPRPPQHAPSWNGAPISARNRVLGERDRAAPALPFSETASPAGRSRTSDARNRHAPDVVSHTRSAGVALSLIRLAPAFPCRGTASLPRGRHAGPDCSRVPAPRDRASFRPCAPTPRYRRAPA
uniref:C2 domain-containing protein n=1 Tax=Oryza meridionalis TaxID=40149 RepID=A0A0E0EQC5_9ORYZ